MSRDTRASKQARSLSCALFPGEGSFTDIDYRKKSGTLASLLEHLARGWSNPFTHCHSRLKRYLGILLLPLPALYAFARLQEDAACRCLADVSVCSLDMAPSSVVVLVMAVVILFIVFPVLRFVPSTFLKTLLLRLEFFAQAGALFPRQPTRTFNAHVLLKDPSLPMQQWFGSSANTPRTPRHKHQAVHMHTRTHREASAHMHKDQHAKTTHTHKHTTHKQIASKQASRQASKQARTHPVGVPWLSFCSEVLHLQQVGCLAYRECLEKVLALYLFNLAL